MPTIGVCITCFNRRERTLRCLRSLREAHLPSGTNLVVYLLDDGSTDGTASAVQAEDPYIRLYKGDGSFYWAGGMRVVYGEALKDRHDFYLWLNDDVELMLDAIERAICTLNALRRSVGGEHLIVGAMSDRDRRTTTYSGLVRASRVFPWKLKRIDPDPDEPVECETVNGNFVLIPGEVAQCLGNIHPAYVQMHADLVLGLAAKRIGVRNWIMPGFAGICDANVNGRKNWKTPGLSLRERLQLMEHPLGAPFRPRVAYSRNFGLWAPIVIAAPYLTLFYELLLSHSKPGKTE
ncbi:glycosyltransferase family 2 protein [Bradyrhizobium sp. PRIMUS42]|uniref:glycosyltransferase family 2 protein n=1 Tax=Bradyrhizobium sp. PRIMUS42 TaxID=2908926 RepID=UPI001FF26970|nr:glycosyltransferase [Bradyrhizobium sp. PRIMUS42]MCJ9729718.1 glycosyltransferase [Bradyrhizobium sp. PRIMUS42]